MLVSALVSSISQVLLKLAANTPQQARAKEYLNFRVVFAYTLFLLSTLLTVFAYRVVPLSFGPILEASSYVYVTIFGVVFFGEKVGALKVCALAFILAGIMLYSLGV